MDKKIKESAKTAMIAAENLQQKVSDALEDAPDDLKEVQLMLSKSLGKIQDKLKDSIEKGEAAAEGSQLQAHLAIMEARDKLEESHDVFQRYLNAAGDKSQPLMDKLELKASLAKMEAEDLWKEHSQELSDKFTDSKEAMTELAGKAAAELQEQLSKWRDDSKK